MIAIHPFNDGAPNLDDFSADVADVKETARVFKALALYLDHKSEAMESRLAGNVNDALRVERKMERIYDALPEWARW